MNTHLAKLLLAFVAVFAIHVSKVEAATNPPPTNFFSSQTYLGDAGNGYSAYYVNNFKTYAYAASTPNYIYKFNFGFLYYFSPDSGTISTDEAYFYDFTRSDYLYTTVSLYPYFYSFNLGSFLYYFEGTSPRQFYEFKTSSYITY